MLHSALAPLFALALLILALHAVLLWRIAGKADAADVRALRHSMRNLRARLDDPFADMPWASRGTDTYELDPDDADAAGPRPDRR